MARDAVLRELDEQKAAVTALLDLNQVSLADAEGLVAEALKDWLAAGGISGRISRFVGERCLKYVHREVIAQLEAVIKRPRRKAK